MSKKLTTKEFQDRLNEIHGNQFTVMEEYINNETKIKIFCHKCNNIIEKRPAKMTGSSAEGCYICNGHNYYKTKGYLQKEVDIKFPGEYKIIGDYVRARQPLTVQRLKCGHVYDISPDNLLRGKGCPGCGIRQSSYMNIVEAFLDKFKIVYIKEKIFNDCRYIRPLPFDYYLPNDNTCIEVDGEFHFPENTIYINNPELYDCIVVRDSIKTQYCQDNGIKLIRLPYFEKDKFDEILYNNLIKNH